MNGIQLHEKLKHIDEELPITFVTALDAAEELTSVLPNLDPSYIIKKPVSTQDLLSIINSISRAHPLKVTNGNG